MHTVRQADEVDITQVSVADLENAVRVRENQDITGIQVGNVMWRSPEAHAGIGIGKASDIFSFGIIGSLVARPCSSPTHKDLLLNLI